MSDIGKDTGDKSAIYRPDQSAPTEKSKKTVMEIIRDHTIRGTEALRGNLKGQHEDAMDDEIGESTRRRLKGYMGELDILDSMLRQVTERPSPLRPVIRQLRQQTGKFESDNRSIIRWAPSPELPLGPDNAQNQLSVITVITAPESISAAIYAESVKGSPPEVTLQRLLARAQGQMISVNTSAVYRDIITERASVDPQAGISFIWRRGENTARMAGVTYVGRNPFTYDLGLTIPYQDFYLMQRAIMDAAKPQPRSNTPKLA